MTAACSNRLRTSTASRAYSTIHAHTDAIHQYHAESLKSDCGGVPRTDPHAANGHRETLQSTRDRSNP
jgi:hypothetical protein